jgi:hypothetical protein
MARLLLDHGADPNARASLRERVWEQDVISERVHRDITPLRWGHVFHNRMIVGEPAMELLVERGGHD